MLVLFEEYTTIFHPIKHGQWSEIMEQDNGQWSETMEQDNGQWSETIEQDNGQWNKIMDKEILIVTNWIKSSHSFISKLCCDRMI